MTFEYPAFSKAAFATPASPVVPVPFWTSIEIAVLWALLGVGTTEGVGVREGAIVGTAVGDARAVMVATNGVGVGVGAETLP